MRQRAHRLRSSYHVCYRRQGQVAQLDDPDRDLSFTTEAGHDHLRVSAVPSPVDDVEVCEELCGVESDEPSQDDGDRAADVTQRGHRARQSEHSGADDGGDDVHDSGEDGAAAADA